jgi:acyl-lipid omega-6 desaturase (Delta-12 desaturase)
MHDDVHERLRQRISMTTAPLDLRREAARPRPQWGGIVNRYQKTVLWKAVLQLITTFVPLGIVFYLMYRSLALPYIVTLLLALPAAGLLVRTFIIMHDCGHGSFFKSRRANEIVGWITGVMTLTPFAQWRKDHALHHASSGDLDRRGHGDIDTITVKEYMARSAKERRKYRFTRHPAVMLGLGPLYLMVSQRRLMKNAHLNDLQSFSVYSTNAAIAAIIVGFSLWIGFGPFMAIYFPAIYIAAAAGILLFYVQHQFEDTYWNEHGEWDYATAAIHGSSYFKMNPVLQWFTGNIGLHHVHHLYNLQRCHNENPMFHEVTVLTIPDAIRTMRLKLWDEEERRLVPIRELEARARMARGEN